MNTKSPLQQKGQENILSSLNVAIDFLNLAKDSCGSIPPAQAVFGSVSILLTMIKVRFPLFSDDPFQRLTRNQDSMANRTDYVELGLACADVCKALERGMNGRRMDELSRSVFEAIGQLTT